MSCAEFNSIAFELMKKKQRPLRQHSVFCGYIDQKQNVNINVRFFDCLSASF